MSTATHLKIISTFDRWAHGSEPVGVLLQHALEFFRLTLPDALSVRLYHLNDYGVSLGAATEDKTSTQTITRLGDDSIYREVLSYRLPVFDRSRMVWVAPLNSEATTFGVLEVPVLSTLSGSEETEAATPVEPDTEGHSNRDWIGLLTEYLGQALDTRKLQDMARLQAQTSTELTQAASYADIASALAKRLPGTKQFISINLFLFDEQEQFSGFRTIVTANRNQVFLQESRLEGVRLDEFGSVISQIMEDARPRILNDVASRLELSDRVRAWLAGYQVQALCNFPMRTQGKTFGSIVLNSVSGPLYLAEPELVMYQSLVDQIATLVRLGRVTEEADYTSAISERQKLAFNELVAGQDFVDMAAIIARHMLPGGGGYLGIAEMNYDSGSKLGSWRLMATANRKRGFRWQDEATLVAAEALAQPLLNSLRDGEMLVVSDPQYEAIVGAALAVWLRQEKVRHLMTLPITLNERSLAVLLVFSLTERPFTREEINAFSNIAGQMGVLVQVRMLLDQARTARALVDNLVLANRLVTVASDTAYMAQGISYTIARNLTGAAVTLFDEPVRDQQQPRFRRLVGFSRAGDILPVETATRYADVPDLLLLGRLRAGQPAISADLNPAAPGYLSPETRALYGGLGATWTASFGLRSGDWLLGTLDLLNDKPVQFSAEEIDAYSTLADQIGSTIRSQQLTRESEAAQAMAAQLVQTNLRISGAQDFNEMAQAIIESLPTNVTATGILLFNEPLVLGERPQWIKTEVVATREGTMRPELYDHSTGEMNPDELPLLKEILSGGFVVIDDTRIHPPAAIPALLRFMEQVGLYGFVGVGLQSNGRYSGILGFGAPDFINLSPLQLQNLRAIAGQLSIAIENRILVNQTGDALSFVALQYEISNLLHRAQEPAKMLAAVYQFVQDIYPVAELGIVDPAFYHARIIVRMDANGVQSAPLNSGALSTLPLNREQLSREFLSQTREILSDDGRTLLLPLTTTADRVIGVLHFTSPDAPVHISDNTLLALRSLADQLTTTLQNLFLIEQMEGRVQESRTLYQAGSALMTADDPVQVLEVLYDLVAEDATSASLISLGYDVITEALNSYRLEAVVTPEGTTRAETELATFIGQEMLTRFRESWGPQSSVIEFAETRDQVLVSRPMLEYLAGTGSTLKIESNITIPIIEDGVLIQLVNISYDQPRRFDNLTRRLFAALRDQMAIVLQNQRLIRNTRESAARLGIQVRVLQTLNQLALSLNSIRDEQELLDKASQAFFNALRLDHVGIALLNPDGVSSTVASEYPSRNMRGMQIEDTNELQVQIRHTITSIYLPDVPNAEGLSDNSRAALSAAGLQTMLLLPLLDTNDNFMGSVGLEFYQKGREFTAEMIDTGRAIAAQLAIGLQNIREVARTRRQTIQLERLARFSQRLQSQLDPAAVLETLANDAMSILPMDHLSVMLFDSEIARLRLVLQYYNGQLFRTNSSTPIIIEGTTAGRAWLTRQFLAVNHLRYQDELVHTFNSQMQAVMVTPLVVRETTLGVIEISSVAPYSYTETDHSVFQQMVSLVGVAQENAETYIQSQRYARSKALVNDISSRIQRQTELDDILNVTLTELGKALGARRARVRLGQHPEAQDKPGTPDQW